MRSKLQKGYTAMEMLIVLIIIATVPFGWAANIFQLVHHIDDPLNAHEILRFIGVLVFPLGVMLGWIGCFF